ncbi:MAG TPA: NAD(P)H-binding protein [Euzebya sp.]|nr:NAD(P)H-binding protein [Euzebya sp.]
MVTGVDNAVGRHAVRLLAATAGEVRAFVQAVPGEDPEGLALVARLRAMGCKVAHGFLDDEAHVETALEQVHTVLHVLGRPTDDPDSYLEQTATVIGSAIGAGCRRLVLLSDVALSSPTPSDLTGNAWLAALREAEEMAAAAPLESVVLRCAVVHGAGDVLTTSLASGVLGPQPDGAHWPVAAVDVATTAVLADAERELDTDLHVVVALAGPQRLCTADLAQALQRVVGAGAGEALPAHARDLLLATIERPAGALGGQGTTVEAAWS